MTAVGIVAAIAISLLLAAIITPSFTKLEDKAIAGHVDRTRQVLADYADKIAGTVRDYGDWNDSYAYMAHPDSRFERASVSSSAMANIGVDGIAYVTPQGRVVVAHWSDPVNGLENAAKRQRLLATIGRIDPTRALAGRRSRHFYARVGDSVAAIGIAQVRRSDGTGSPRGYVMLARVITSQRVSDMLGLDARVDVAADGDTQTVTSTATQMTIAVPMIGADGHAVATTRVTVPREVSLLGRRMLMFAVAGSTVLLLLVLIALRRMIARLVLGPLHRVERQMQRVRASGSLTLLEEDGRRDEIGSLGRSFNAMLRQLQDLREQIEVQSFDLGRSESAVAVMHNVRNALNPISTILSQGIAQAPPIDRIALDRAIRELARSDLPETRRLKLTAFVTASVAAEAASRAAMRDELTIGREAMAHVLEIIGRQQQAAHERPRLDVCDVTDIIARNATIVRYAQGASIAFSFPAGSVYVLGSRVILSQVIGNLFGNAVESIAARGLGTGSISAAITQGDGRVTIAIRDDGEGFAADVGTTLFQRGFSTRTHKSGGLGLHWCANSVNAMNGTLRVESDGPGLGAVAILTLDACDAGVAQAA